MKIFLSVFFLSFFSIRLCAFSDSTLIRSDSLTEPRSTNDESRPGPFDWLTNLPGDWWNWSKQTFNAQQLPVIGGLAVITAMTIITDYQTWQFTKKPYDNNKTFHDVNNVTSYIGDGKVQFGLSMAYLGYGFIFNDSRAIRTASEMVEVILVSGGVVQFLKHITGRESPFVATTPTGRWDFFPNQKQYIKHTPNHDAFPSGHIATALATLQVIIENYPEKEWIKYVGYPIIGSIAIGLCATSIHWWSDIPLGMAIGYSFGVLVSHPKEEKAESHSENGFSPQMNFLVLGNGVPAVGLSLKW